MTRRAVIYSRLSHLTEASTSISRQLEECRARCAREGWIVVAELIDPNVSGGQRRANADAALAMLTNYEADVLVVAAFDRWSRMGITAVADLTEVLDARPGALFVTCRDGLSSDQSTFRISAAVISEVARQERENVVARARASVARLVRDHRWPGGIPPFGYQVIPAPSGPGTVLVPDPDQAAIVRELAARVLADEPLSRICLDLNERRVPTRYRAAADRRLARGEESVTDARANIWGSQAIRGILTGDAVLGRVHHRGQLLRDDDGLPVAVWPPILDLDTWLRLRAKLQADIPGPQRTQRRRAARLLSGMLACGSCGQLMRVNGAPKGGPPVFQCGARGRGDVRCRRAISIRAAMVEPWVEAWFLDNYGDSPEMERVELSAETNEAAEVERAIKDATMRLAEAADAATFETLRSLQVRREELRLNPPRRQVELRPTGRTYAEAWDAADVDGRRRILAANLLPIIVGPATRRGRHATVDGRLTMISRPAFVLDGFLDYPVGRIVVDVDDGPDIPDDARAL